VTSGFVSSSRIRDAALIPASLPPTMKMCVRLEEAASAREQRFLIGFSA